MGSRLGHSDGSMRMSLTRLKVAYAALVPRRNSEPAPVALLAADLVGLDTFDSNDIVEVAVVAADRLCAGVLANRRV